MKHESFRGTGKVFQFSIKQICFSKSWAISTLLTSALLLFLIPLVFMLNSPSRSPDEKGENEENTESMITKIFYCDETEGKADYSVFSETWVNPLEFTPCDTMEEAMESANETLHSLALEITKPDSSFHLIAVLPEITTLERSDADEFVSALKQNFSLILMQKAELSGEAFTELSIPVHTDVETLSIESSDMNNPQSSAENMLSFLIPFIALMLLYFMVIFYGQSTANSVISEKNSKLIETMMTAVSPFALLLGKLFASAAAAILQLIIWIVSAFIGIYAAVLMLLSSTPDSAAGIAQTVQEIVQQNGLISVSGIFLTIFLLFLGFLLYLSLGAISGALASKSEDLGKTNFVFTLVLLFSFFMCLDYSNADVNNSFISSALWLKIFPFTSVMTLPGDLILGKASSPVILISFAVLLLSTFALIALAAVIYKLLILYRGKVPSARELIRMLKESRHR